ncbi:hypothetical protein [Natrinema saccharevitans]|uniref:hypothetical protein n=1 Tax=Natrinema saccharevitans TaxID=301967 RepID=UPI0011154F22|nr:hypothetical protein [Natrinema saccharevitans]
MVERKIRNVKSGLLLIIGIVLLSNGVLGIPQLPREGWFFIAFGLVLFISGIHTIYTREKDPDF